MLIEGATEEEAKVLEKFGFKINMVYQEVNKEDLLVFRHPARMSEKAHSRFRQGLIEAGLKQFILVEEGIVVEVHREVSLPPEFTQFDLVARAIEPNE